MQTAVEGADAGVCLCKTVQLAVIAPPCPQEQRGFQEGCRRAVSGGREHLRYINTGGRGLRYMAWYVSLNDQHALQHRSAASHLPAKADQFDHGILVLG